jgi:hypothetical protein
MRPVVSDLLVGFNPTTAEKKYLFWKSYDEKKKLYDWQKRFEGLLQNWRTPDYGSRLNFLHSLSQELYMELAPYPVPIPYCLFFSFQDDEEAEKMKWIGELADKWLKDVFSGESFYERNKEYFSRAEVKYFLTCEWQELKIINNSPQPSSYFDLIEQYFDAKIKANELKLSVHTFIDEFEDYYSFKMAIEYFNFICDNKKYIKDNSINNNVNIDDDIFENRLFNNRNNNFRDYEIEDISEYIKSEYIKLKKKIDFKAITYQGLKRLSDEWHILNILKYKFNNYYEKHNIGEFFNNIIVEDYFEFILNNIKKIDDREEISDISDYLKYEYIDTNIDFDFNNRTWQNLKRLSDEWHLENKIANEPYLKKYINTKWEKSSIKDFSYEKGEKIWIIQEITSGKLLYEESQSMHHCCFSYIDNCMHKDCFIFSIKCKNSNETKEDRVATVEISKNMELIQARGEYNRHIGKETEDIIKQWANENTISINSNFSRNIDFIENDN